VEFATPLSHDEEHIDAYHDDEPLRYLLELAGETTKLGCRQGQFSQLTVL
jgi:hypothetical protein